MYTLQNNSKLTLTHDNYILAPGKILSLPDNIAKIWLKIDGIIEYKDPKEAKQEKAKLETENKKLKDELAKLKNSKQAKVKNK